ncbi:MAG: peroxiredoxin [Bdellovibrionota bacterium]
MNKEKLLKWMMVPFGAGLLGIAAGTAAPDFTAKNQDGKMIRLSDITSKKQFVLMYFYPKDDTPGCTKEACDFRDKYAEIRKLNAVVLGVSRQDEKSHQAFIAKHKLPFDLLIDEKGDIAKLYGVGTMPIVGFHQRQSILIGPDGKVVKFYDNVDPKKHVAEVIADIQGAKK